ncbi:hypothetical protein BpHYR1_004136 [Brachionus plicatilis]|uniref:Uncharacterized protein n=1 Tax=Brachionus plicatilis TaxID=10195 RepID=A0A3M7QIA9_BRAPC|nr:hypothetical protein BpHYR1_004136 [Brachionus plicatilis]
MLNIKVAMLSVQIIELKMIIISQKAEASKKLSILATCKNNKLLQLQSILATNQQITLLLKPLDVFHNIKFKPSKKNSIAERLDRKQITSHKLFSFLNRIADGAIDKACCSDFCLFIKAEHANLTFLTSYLLIRIVSRFIFVYKKRERELCALVLGEELKLTAYYLFLSSSRITLDNIRINRILRNLLECILKIVPFYTKRHQTNFVLDLT